MEALLQPTDNNFMDPRWGRMFILSLVLHMAAFSAILFVSQPMPTMRIRGEVYEVNLVELPEIKRLQETKGVEANEVKSVPLSKKSVPSKRISTPKMKEKPVVIAKRTIEAKKQKPKKRKVTSSELINRALSKIERKVKAEKKDHVNQALARIETQVKLEAGKKNANGQASVGISIRWYQMEVEDKIKSNWSYPVALSTPKSQKNLEATIAVKVQKDGTILKSWFVKRSSNAVFDQSVFKAVERSDPLPSFPEGYRKTYDQIEINFNLSDLEEY
jgi:colicin import membrane protein